MSEDEYEAAVKAACKSYNDAVETISNQRKKNLEALDAVEDIDERIRKRKEIEKEYTASLDDAGEAFKRAQIAAHKVR